MSKLAEKIALVRVYESTERVGFLHDWMALLCLISRPSLSEWVKPHEEIAHVKTR